MPHEFFKLEILVFVPATSVNTLYTCTCGGYIYLLQLALQLACTVYMHCTLPLTVYCTLYPY